MDLHFYIGHREGRLKLNTPFQESAMWNKIGLLVLVSQSLFPEISGDVINDTCTSKDKSIISPQRLPFITVTDIMAHL